MDADFFYVGTPRITPARLLAMIAAHVDPSIALRAHDANTKDYRERAAIGRRYAQLLQASIPPQLSLSLNVDTDMDLMGARIYIRVYWPILIQEYWQYDGGIPVIYGGYSMQGHASFFLHNQGLTPFFPALAIRDRMVIVPEGQNRVLKGSLEDQDALAKLRPDVTEVNFSDEAKLDQAVAAVGHSLRAELRHELRAYGSFRKPGAWDLADAATHLGVTLGFLQRALEQEAPKATRLYEQLSCEFSGTEVITGCWNRVMLKIRNDSDVDLAELTAQVIGPAEVLPARISAAVKARSSTEVPVAVKPSDPGAFPLEIALLLPEDQVLADLLPRHQIWLESITSTG
jgi:hypothetical protein